MRLLGPVELNSISGSSFKTDAGIYTLAVSGATLSLEGAALVCAGLAKGNKGLVTAGLVSFAFGAGALATAVASEYTGYSEAYGWYTFAKNAKYYASYIY